MEKKLLKVSELQEGKYYEDVLSGGTVLIISVWETDAYPTAKNSDATEKVHGAVGRYYNRISGLFEDTDVSDNQLREF